MLGGDDAFAVIEPVWNKANIYESLAEYEQSILAYRVDTPQISTSTERCKERPFLASRFGVY